MKRWMALAIAAALAMTGMQTAALALQQENAEDNVFYLIRNDHAILTYMQGDDAAAEVPDELNGKKLTEIGAFAFEEMQGLTELYIPGTVEKIDPEAFEGLDGVMLIVENNSEALRFAIQHEIPYRIKGAGASPTGNAPAIDYFGENVDSDLESIEYARNIFPFRNGYACICDDEFNMHYVDSEGRSVFKGDIVQVYGQYYTAIAPFAPQGGVVLGYDGSNSLNMFDINGNIVKTFDGENYTAVGAPSEGYTVAQGKTGNIPYVAYYDAAGQEVMRFENKVWAGVESSFSQGRAILCEMSVENEYSYIGANWPVRWSMIDIAGNQIPLRIPDIAAAFSILSEAGHSGEDEALQGMHIMNVHPFNEGESYTTAIVRLYYSKWNYSMDAVATISRQGDVKLVAPASVVSDCCNGHFLMGYSNRFDRIGDAADGSVLNVAAISSLQNQNPGYIRFIDDGTLYVTVQDGACIITPEGELVEGPFPCGLFSCYQADPYCTGDVLSTYYTWQVLETSEDFIFEKDGLYSFAASDADRQRVYGFCDIYGNAVIEAKYTGACNFSDEFSIVCQNIGKSYEKVPRDISFINENGELVNRVYLDSSEQDFSADMLMPEDPEEIFQDAVQKILETEGQFRTATNLAVLPTGVGEFCGYLYDVATFDLPGLIKHIHADASREYRDEAARLIMQTMLNNYDEDVLGYTLEFMSEWEKENLDYAKTGIEIVSMCEKGLSLLDEELNFGLGDQLKPMEKAIKSVKTFGSIIDQMELSVTEKLLVALLISNYEENKAYVEDCIRRAESAGNTEMQEIYKIVQTNMKESYEQYIEDAEQFIKDNFQGELEFDSIVDLVNTDLSIIGVSPVKDTIKAVGKAQNAKNVNVWLFVHSVAVSTAEQFNTDDTYSLMQKIYENAIVLNAMVQNVNDSNNTYKATKSAEDYEDLCQKAKLLARYRMIVLDNLKEYAEVANPGEYFLDGRQIGYERYVLMDAIERIDTLPVH